MRFDPFEMLRRDLKRIFGGRKVVYHATYPENIQSIMKEGLRPPVYLMNGLQVVKAIEKSTREQYSRYGRYSGGDEVLLKITLPGDWPLVRDEASETMDYVKSLQAIPPEYIKVESYRWP